MTDKVGNAPCKCASEPWVIIGFYKCGNWGYGMRAVIARAWGDRGDKSRL